MKRYSLLMALTLGAASSNAQDYKKFEWTARPVLHTVSGTDADEAAVFLEDGRTVEYNVEKEGLFIYKTVHRVVHINSDKGVELFNRVYLPFDEGVKMMDVKARTVLPNGRVISLDEKNIKDIQEDNRSYKIFALEGLAKGCEVEYYYTLKKYPSFFGRELFSFGIPVQATHFELLVPSNLKFDTRSYNGLPELRDTVIGEKRYVTMDMANLKARPDERYAMSDAHAARVEYKLSYNLGKNRNERLFSWDELARKVNDIYSKGSDKERRKVHDLVEAAGITSSMGTAEKVKRLEAYLKKEFNINSDLDSDDADDLLKVIKGKNASERAITKLFTLALADCGVDFELGLAGDRSDYALDRKLENWNSARHLVLYFPELKKYIAPTEDSYRYPFVPPTWAGTPALFVVKQKLGNMESAFAEMRTIALEDVKYSYNNMLVKAHLDEKMDSLVIDFKNSYAGYLGLNYRAPFVYYPAAEHYKVVKSLISSASKSEQIKSWTVENTSFDQADPYTPFVLNASVSSSELVERAGSKIILKVGDLIGEQAELYEEKERTLDIELAYPHSFHRVIELTIPKGYSAQNLKDLNFNESHADGGKVQFDFTSRYTLEGDLLRIEIDENYNGYFYPKSIFEIFKKVINASADFNKVALVLEKQK